MLPRCLVLCMIFGLAPARLPAAEWTLTRADFSSAQVDLRGIDAGGIATVAGPVTWDDVLELTRAAPSRPAGRFLLLTIGADRLYGAPETLENETLQFKSELLGAISLPLRQVACITRADKPPPALAGLTEDAVTLANGDVVRGIVSGMADGKLAIQVGGNPTAVALDGVQSILFASTGAAPRADERGFRVTLVDGSSLSSPALVLKENRITVTLADGQARPIDVAQVASIEQVNGPVAWLSGLAPAEIVHTPLLDIARPPRMDRSVDGGSIRSADRTFSRGIGVYPRTRITWNIPPRYAAFRTRYAIDGDGPYANVTARILLDGKIAHQQDNITAGRLSDVISLPLNGAKTITLEVDFGANQSVQDSFNWIEPALLAKPPTATRP